MSLSRNARDLFFLLRTLKDQNNFSFKGNAILMKSGFIKADITKNVEGFNLRFSFNPDFGVANSFDGLGEMILFVEKNTNLFISYKNKDSAKIGASSVRFKKPDGSKSSYFHGYTLDINKDSTFLDHQIFLNIISGLYYKKELNMELESYEDYENSLTEGGLNKLTNALRYDTIDEFEKKNCSILFDDYILSSLYSKPTKLLKKNESGEFEKFDVIGNKEYHFADLHYLKNLNSELEVEGKKLVDEFYNSSIQYDSYESFLKEKKEILEKEEDSLKKEQILKLRRRKKLHKKDLEANNLFSDPKVRASYDELKLKIEDENEIENEVEILDSNFAADRFDVLGEEDGRFIPVGWNHETEDLSYEEQQMLLLKKDDMDEYEELARNNSQSISRKIKEGRAS